MKIQFFLLLCLFLLTIKCDNGEEDRLKKLCRGTTSPKNKGDCFSIFNTTVQKEFEMYCCYMEYKVKNEPSAGAEYVKEFKGCEKFDKDEYDDLDTFKENAKADVKKDNNELLEMEIVCDSSAFLKLGLVSLLAALLI